MAKLILATLAVLGIGTAWAYDFTDPDFNKILLDDLLEFDAFAADDDLPILVHAERSKRHAEETPQPPKCKPNGGMRHNKCCNDGFEQSPEMKELKRQCFAEAKKARKAKHHDGGDFDVFSCEKVEKAKEKVLCAMDCVARKQGIVSETGRPDDNRVKEVMRKYFKEGAWQLTVIDEIVETCMAEVAAKLILASQNNTTASTAQQKCSPAPSIFTHCMWRQLNLKCPVELQDQSQQCQKMREKLNKKDAASQNLVKPVVVKPAETVPEKKPEVEAQPPKTISE